MEDVGKAEVIPVSVSVFSGAFRSLVVPQASRGTGLFNFSSKKPFLMWWGMLAHLSLLSLNEFNINQRFYMLYTHTSFSTGFCKFIPCTACSLKCFLHYSESCSTLLFSTHHVSEAVME